MFTKDIKPALVVVHQNGRYDVFSLSPKLTSRDLWLASILEKAGGIAETVEEGRYYFNAQRLGPFKVKTELVKIEL